MSRLDSFIRRVSAQRDCLNAAAGMIADVPGPVLELGLGNGRTYDHLRERLPNREIFVFDRRIAAHSACIPDERHMILGNIDATLAHAMAQIGALAALAHCDIGAGDKQAALDLERASRASVAGERQTDRSRLRSLAATLRGLAGSIR